MLSILILMILSIWLAILTFSVAMCHAAARGDDILAPKRVERMVKSARHGARKHRTRSVTRGRGGS